MEYVPKKTFVEMPLEAVVDREGAANALGMDRRVVGKLQSLGLQPIVGLPEGFQKGDRIGKTQFYRLADVIAYRCQQMIGQRFGDEPVKDPVPFHEAKPDPEIRRLRYRIEELEEDVAPVLEVQAANDKIHKRIYRYLRLVPQLATMSLYKMSQQFGEAGILYDLKLTMDILIQDLSKLNGAYRYRGHSDFDDGNKSGLSGLNGGLSDSDKEAIERNRAPEGVTLTNALEHIEREQRDADEGDGGAGDHGP